MKIMPSMTRLILALIAFFFSTAALRADLVLEQQTSDTNRTQRVIIKLHDDKMRLDQPDDHLSVIVDLRTRDSITLLTTNKTYLQRYGADIKWKVELEKKNTGGTNEMDAMPAPAMDTGKSEAVNGYDTEIYTWSGAHGLTTTLWVAKNFPNYEAIKTELGKLDSFNDSGPHRNAQPKLSALPGMVLKSESVFEGRKVTTSLVSVKVEPVSAILFELPVDYSPWKAPNKTP
jgi:hypothetical protein